MEANTQGRWGIASFVLFAVPALMLLGVCVSRLPGPADDLAYRDFGDLGLVLLALNFGLALGLALLPTARRLNLFEPRYFIAFLFLMVFVARPLQILLFADTRVPSLPADPALIQQALAFGALGIIGFSVGYASRAGSIAAGALPRFRWPWRERRLVGVAAAFWAVGLVGYSIAIVRSGGVRAILGSLQGRRLIEESGSWVFASTLVLAQAATVILGTYFFKTRRLILPFLSSLALSAILSVLLGGRSTVMIYTVSLVVCYFCLRPWSIRRPLRRAVVTGVFVIACVLFIVALGSLRAGLQAADSAAPVSPFDAAGISGRFVAEFSQFDWLVIVGGLVPERLPFQTGATFLHLFTQFVPRALWPGKPDPIEYSVTMLVQGVRSGSPFTIIGELYLNFGVPGIAVGMFVFGFLCRALYGHLVRHRDDPGVALLYSYTFASLVHFFTRSFAPMMFGYLLFIVPTLLALRLVAAAGPHARRPTP